MAVAVAASSPTRPDVDVVAAAAEVQPQLLVDELSMLLGLWALGRPVVREWKLQVVEWVKGGSKA